MINLADLFARTAASTSTGLTQMRESIDRVRMQEEELRMRRERDVFERNTSLFKMMTEEADKDDLHEQWELDPEARATWLAQYNAVRQNLGLARVDAIRDPRSERFTAHLTRAQSLMHSGDPDKQMEGAMLLRSLPVLFSRPFLNSKAKSLVGGARIGAEARGLIGAPQPGGTVAMPPGIAARKADAEAYGVPSQLAEVLAMLPENVTWDDFTKAQEYAAYRYTSVATLKSELSSATTSTTSSAQLLSLATRAYMSGDPSLKNYFVLSKAPDMNGGKPVERLDARATLMLFETPDRRAERKRQELEDYDKIVKTRSDLMTKLDALALTATSMEELTAAALPMIKAYNELNDRVNGIRAEMSVDYRAEKTIADGFGSGPDHFGALGPDAALSPDTWLESKRPTVMRNKELADLEVKKQRVEVEQKQAETSLIREQTSVVKVDAQTRRIHANAAASQAGAAWYDAQTRRMEANARIKALKAEAGPGSDAAAATSRFVPGGLMTLTRGKSNADRNTHIGSFLANTWGVTPAGERGKVIQTVAPSLVVSFPGTGNTTYNGYSTKEYFKMLDFALNDPAGKKLGWFKDKNVAANLKNYMASQGTCSSANLIGGPSWFKAEQLPVLSQNGLAELSTRMARHGLAEANARVYQPLMSQYGLTAAQMAEMRKTDPFYAANQAELLGYKHRGGSVAVATQPSRAGEQVLTFRDKKGNITTYTVGPDGTASVHVPRGELGDGPATAGANAPKPTTSDSKPAAGSTKPAAAGGKYNLYAFGGVDRMTRKELKDAIDAFDRNDSNLRRIMPRAEDRRNRILLLRGELRAKNMFGDD